MPIVPVQQLLDLNGGGGLPMKDYKAHVDRVERINAWKKKAWLDFCKMVMEEDKRYSLLPLTDYYNNMKETGMLSRLSRASGVFSGFCLRRDGTLQDVYIIPHEPNLGLVINAGSKYTGMNLTGFPSKALVWPTLRMADDLERQFIREVSIEANKHSTQLPTKPSKRRTNAKSTPRTTKHDDSDKLSSDTESNG